MILDTSVVSALMKERPDPPVRAWLDRQPLASVSITAITVFEVRLGLERLTRGARRSRLESTFHEMLAVELEERVLPFDAGAAEQAAAIAAARMRSGVPQDYADTQIAGIVVWRQATLATRNTRHFPGIDVVDPWQASEASRNEPGADSAVHRRPKDRA